MRASRRGFTLLEMMLAAILGAMVVLACSAMFMSIDRQTLVGQGRYEETLGLAQTHETIERSFQLLVMSDSPPPIQPASPTGLSESADAAAAALTPSEPPRLVLESDPLGEGSMTLLDGRRISPQRLEVTLRSPPIFVPRDERRELGAESAREERRRRRAAAAAERRSEREAARGNGAASGRDSDREPGRRSGRGRDGEADTEGNGPGGSAGGRGGGDEPDGGAPADVGGRDAGSTPAAATELVDITIAPGLRGAFELVFDPPRPGSADEGSWSLWWRQLGVEERSSLTDVGRGDVQGTIWPEGMVPGATRLVAGIERLHWRVYRRGEWLDEWRATWPDDLPAYVSLEVQMTSGTYHEWLFEIGWTTGKEPGTESEAEAAPDPAGGNRGGQNQGGTGPGGRSRPGVSPSSTSPASRPSPATPASRSGGQGGGR